LRLAAGMVFGFSFASKDFMIDYQRIFPQLHRKLPTVRDTVPFL
jgi:hypothetical protein